MLDVLSRIDIHKAVYDKEMEEIVKWTLGLPESDRMGYLYFSLKQKAVQLRLERRKAHRKEEYEKCAAINKVLAQLQPFLDRIPEDE